MASVGGGVERGEVGGGVKWERADGSLRLAPRSLVRDHALAVTGTVLSRDLGEASLRCSEHENCDSQAG